MVDYAGRSSRRRLRVVMPWNDDAHGTGEEARVEIQAVRSEFQAWGWLSQETSREEILRVKATVLRCRRLVEEFSSQILGLFSGRVEKLGRALGVPEHAMRVFAESNIRGHMVFQVSKLAAALLRSIRERLGSPAWDILVPGKAVGQLSTVSALEEIVHGPGQPLVVLARNAAGDEEIPPNVVGIILAQEMPHLSHLAVRARQAGVVFVSCEEPGEFEQLRQLDKQLVTLVATPEKVVWEKATTAVQPLAAAPKPAPRLADLLPACITCCLPIEEADKRMIELEDHIKQLGRYDVTVRVGAGVTATVKVWVVRA